MTYSIEGATVLVTGGAGLIGSHIVDQLLDAGAAEVRVLDNLVRGRLNNLARALNDGRVYFQEGDIRDRDAVAQAVDGCDYVFHQAALRITLCAEKPRDEKIFTASAELSRAGRFCFIRALSNRADHHDCIAAGRSASLNFAQPNSERRDIRELSRPPN